MHVEQLKMIGIGFFCAFICTVLAQSTKFSPDGTCGIQNPIKECPGTTCEQWLYDEDNCMTCECSPTEDLIDDVVPHPEAKSFMSRNRRSVVRLSIRGKGKSVLPYPAQYLWNTTIEGNRYVIPYWLSRNLTDKAVKAINKAMAEIEDKTCIKFRTRTTEENYILFHKGWGCFTFVGRYTAGNGISVGEGCEKKGTVIHLIMHNMGFFHEHQRPDRDEYVKVLVDNMPEEKKMHYQLMNHLDTQGLPYDYGSIMHSNGSRYAVNTGKPTMTFANGSRLTGTQDEGLSDMDVQKVAALYNCAALANNVAAHVTNTATTTRVPMQEGDCVDKSPYCYRYLTMCTTDSDVREYCPITCKVCNPEHDGSTTSPETTNPPVPMIINPECIDLSPFCGNYSRKGLCTNPKYSFAPKYCPKSCKICQAVIECYDEAGSECNDVNPYCSDEHVSMICKKTCNRCIPS